MNHCYLFIGPSGSGKTSLAEKAFTPDQKIISYTTRAPRDGEKHGRDYFFISKKEFKQMVNRDQFAEYDVYESARSEERRVGNLNNLISLHLSSHKKGRKNYHSLSLPHFFYLYYIILTTLVLSHQ